ncbi:MAG TPA: M67 family metallopeptidase [Solirubrobacteraceae bacterium]
MIISRELLDQLIEHALADPANEVCGVLSVDPGPPAQAVRSYRATNIHHSALKFEIDSLELLELWQTIEGEGFEMGAVYHSHVRSAPYPSQTDINFAASWPGVEWIIIGLGNGEPEVCSYLIVGSEVSEVPLEIVAAA